MVATAIGIDLGGTALRAALVDSEGCVLAHVQTQTAATEGHEAVIDQMKQLVSELRRARPEATPLGVGIGSPGPVDIDRGIVLSPPTLSGWHSVPLADILARSLGLPVILDNDAHAAALGEWEFGAARGLDHFVYITVSTGIGGGVVCDGRLLRGQGGRAGHVGHMAVTDTDVICGCGNRGCWEALASATALGLAARRAAAAEADSLINVLANDAPIDARIVGAAARRGDRLALQLVEREAELLGAGITSLIHLYAPERVIVGGGLSALFDMMQPTIEAVIEKRAMTAFRSVRLEKAALGERTGVIGAAALCLRTRDRGSDAPG